MSLLRRLDEAQHHAGLHWRWICDIHDMSYGMDATSPSFPGYPKPRNPLFLAVNWWFNGLDVLRRPVRHWRHARGEHWVLEFWRARVPGPRVSLNQVRVLRRWGIRFRRPLDYHWHECRLCDWSEKDVRNCRRVRLLGRTYAAIPSPRLALTGRVMSNE